jgi:hypothetical protein
MMQPCRWRAVLAREIENVTRQALDRQPLLTDGFVHKVVRLEQEGDGEMEILLIEAGKRRDGSHGYWIERHVRFLGTDGNPSRERFGKLDEARESMSSRVGLFTESGWRVVSRLT